MTPNPSSDPAFANATTNTARTLDQASRGGLRILERFHPNPRYQSTFLQPTFNDFLEQETIGHVLDIEPTLDLPNWDPLPGGADVVVTNEAGLPRFVGELKMRDTDQMLWDVFKMLDALTLESVEASYLTIGASNKQWAKASEACTEIFQETGTTDLSSVKLFENNKVAWWYILDDSSGRPTSIPETFSTRLISNEPLMVDGEEGSLRCVALDLEDEERISFDQNWFHGNWPLTVEPCERYLDRPPWKAGKGRLLYGARLKGSRRSPRSTS